MDLPNILNNKGGSAAATVDHFHHHFATADPSPHHHHPQQQQPPHHQQQQLPSYQPVSGARSLSNASSDRPISPYSSDPAAGFSSRPSAAVPGINMASAPRYAESVQLPQHYSMIANPYPTPTASIDGGFGTAPTANDYQPPPTAPPVASNVSLHPDAEPVKSFACTTCGKSFARRSDLARHERIHTGVRPHACDFPGCDKQFIQRSALTVHARVHTGEKPHMCEHCTKHFSDSSSLARHRRIHSGKRPYKCPYADCQKTFTRRTTLTRHQAHHTGTVEEAAAATAAALAQRPPGQPGRTRSDGGYYEGGSAPSTPSQAQRTMSMSPSVSEIPQLPMFPRHHSDFGFSSAGLPPHLRADFAQHSPRSGSTSPSLTAFGTSALGTVPNTAGTAPNPHAGPSGSMRPMHHRPSLTSHPAMYGPPSTLEPHPNHHDSRNVGTATNSGGSVAGSPHLGNMGWQSPNAAVPMHPTSAAGNLPQHMTASAAASADDGSMSHGMSLPSLSSAPASHQITSGGHLGTTSHMSSHLGHASHGHLGHAPSGPSHLGGAGNLPTITGHALPPASNFMYSTESAYGMPAAHPLYYPSSNMRRPHSATPDHFEPKARLLPSEVWTGQM